MDISFTAVQTWMKNLYTENQNLKIEVNALKEEIKSLRQENQSLRNSENNKNSPVILPAASCTAQSDTNNDDGNGINGSEGQISRKRPRIECIDGDGNARNFENRNDDDDLNAQSTLDAPQSYQDQNKTTSGNEGRIHENENQRELDGITIAESDIEKLAFKQELIEAARPEFEETGVFSSLDVEESRMSMAVHNERCEEVITDDERQPSIDSTPTLMTFTRGRSGQGHNSSIIVPERKDKDDDVSLEIQVSEKSNLKMSFRKDKENYVTKKKKYNTRSTNKYKNRVDNREQQNDEIFEIERILSVRFMKGKREFLIEWTEYDEDENSWEPEDILDCEDLIKEFIENLNATATRKKVDEKISCFCGQPESNRFMIGCDRCEKWIHGKCVGVTTAQGRRMEEDVNSTWHCPPCTQIIRMKSVISNY